ncbi:MAG TPA: 5'/3'-nucleotidase SurE [Gemmatales bacterium]|nr:5'/3'-nucleotidase SurE [Gemmatales bacterium]
MRILLCNDDGIFAPGLRALRRELRKIGDVTVVAPATEQSAVGHSITLLTPLLVQEVYEGDERIGWAVEGRPADCVKLALTELLDAPPDLLVSGINAGSNAGINVLYSGTVAAAIEGAFYRVPSVAISLEYQRPLKLDFETAAQIGRRVLTRILQHRLEPGLLINVNIPSLDAGLPQGGRVVPQATRPYKESFDRRSDPRGRTYFWISTEIKCPEHAGDTDVQGLAENCITITPLKFDLTDEQHLAPMRDWNWDLDV